MKARVKATGEIVEVYPSIHKGYDYDGSDGYSYMKEDIIILDDEPDYWTRLEHQYAGMAMQGILSNQDYLRSLMHTKHDDYRVYEVVPDVAVRLSHALVEKLKMKQE